MNTLAFVTDDNPVNLKVATAFLTRLGWVVEQFSSASAMLTRLEDVQPAVILLDISMPDIGGEEACSRIRACPAWHHVRVIAYTAHAMDQDRERFMNSGFDGVLIKPINIAALTQAIGSPPSAS
jgi:CheY-like chemotaxis protein